MAWSSRARDPSFRVLAVCTANLCRSPIVEHLLDRAATDAGVEWRVRSAGVHAREGRPVHPLALQVLAERDVTVSPDWVSRRLTAPDIADADLIVTAEAAHRQAVLRLAPGAVRRTFLLLELAVLLGLESDVAADPSRPVRASNGRRIVDLAAQARSRPHSRDQQSHELPDPIEQPVAAFRTLADRIEDAAAGIVRAG